MNKRLRNIGLYVLIVILVIIVGTTFLDRPTNTVSATRTIRYSDFVEAVQDNQVSRVLLSPDKGTAQVVESDGGRALVNLAPDNDLYKSIALR